MDSYGDLPSDLRVDRRGGVVVLTLNRPEDMNAIGPALHRALAVVWPMIAADPEARAVVLTGAGKAFSAGGDLGMMLELHESESAREATMAELATMVSELLRFPLPVIAAVNGPAVGMGCNLALLSDVVLVAERAYLADPHVGVGLVAGDGGAAFWPLLGNILRLKEHLFTGDRISATDAVELGLATRVVHGPVLDEAMAVATRMARQPQQALRDTKRVMNLHLARVLDGAFLAGMAAERASMQSAEHRAIVQDLIARSSNAPTSRA